MSFDKDTRNLLARTVTACRRRLTEDVTDQLRGVYGLHPDGTVLPLGKLTHLSQDQTAAARRLRDLLEHYTAGAAGKDQERRTAAYERMVLEISFTFLNRLAALRLCEERELVVECVRRGTASDGFQLFERVSGGALGARYDAYRVFIECLFDELALDLGVLFERLTPQSSVFPTERCMEDVLAELNKSELTSLWTEDETIGWIYQYFNPPEERKAMREASQAPRNSRELAVRNQFFTPRYVVEFLTDNTLGRIWYEMRKGGTALKEECRYLVLRPNEIFLAVGENAPADREDGPDVSQNELLRKPVYIAHRPKKDPRDLRVIDPACGSGHFLLYAFDLFERIYEEAWADPQSPKSDATGNTLKEDFETLDELRHAAPKLIIEHNLHGIDIDARAVQIAALALWLRAQKSWANLSLKAVDRPRIDRSNIVTAEPMPGEDDLRREFTGMLKPRVLGQLVDVVFEKMRLAGEAGPLLKIEEEIRDAIAKARKQWLEVPKPEQQFLFPGMADAGPKQQELRFDFSGVTEEGFWEQAEDRILEALKDYAERAENGYAVRRRLFAEDAARGFAFIDLCRKRYDIALMNPPFGSATDTVYRHLVSTYPNAYADLAVSFMALLGRMVDDLGFLGAITSRAYLQSSDLEQFRNEIILPGISLLVDLGSGVMDGAWVEASLQVLRRNRSDDWLLVVDRRGASEAIKSNPLSDDPWATAHDGEAYFYLPVSLFRNIPKSRLAYRAESSAGKLITDRSKIYPNIAVATTGLRTFEDERFYRLWWEVPSIAIGADATWRFIAKNTKFAAYYYPLHIVVKWECNGRELAEKNIIKNGQTAQSRQGSRYYGHAGLSFSRRSEPTFAVKIQPSGCAFSSNAGVIFCKKESIGNHYLIALLNSTPFRAAFRLLANKYSFTSGHVHSLAWYEPNEDQLRRLRELGRCATITRLDMESLDEVDPLFRSLPVCRTDGHLLSTIDRVQRAIRTASEELKGYQNQIDLLVCEIYGLEYNLDEWAESRATPADVARASISTEADDIVRRLLSFLVGCVFGRFDVRLADAKRVPAPEPFVQPPPCSSGMLRGKDGFPYHTPPNGYPIEFPSDGILVDDISSNSARPHQNDIVRRIRDVLDLFWKDKAHDIEQQFCDVIGVSDLRDYFRSPAAFFEDHSKRYSKSGRQAPIYWPLSTKSGSYTLWLYYHRLTDQTLYAAVNKYVGPKIAEIDHALVRIEEELETAFGREATRLTARLEEARVFLGELQEMRGEMLRVAALPYRPNLNDGVIINAAPLHNLFRLRSWAKDTGDCWKKLQKGDYDWAHLAYTIWPERVREVCRKDRSIAIAHGVEDLCEVTNQTTKKSGRRRRRKQEAAG